jgi:DNA-binding FadR family transcriptional regulator
MSLQQAREVAPQMGDLGTREHERLIEAIRHREPEAATEIMREHLERTARRVGH